MCNSNPNSNPYPTLVLNRKIWYDSLIIDYFGSTQTQSSNGIIAVFPYLDHIVGIMETAQYYKGTLIEGLKRITLSNLFSNEFEVTFSIQFDSLDDMRHFINNS